MSRKTKQLPLYILLLLLTHGIALTFVNALSLENVLDHEAHSALKWLVVFCPVMIVPLVFGFKIRSWKEFVVYVWVTVVIWQVSFILDDWLMGRLSDPSWLIDKDGTWGNKVLKRCVMPAILISIGGLLGQLKGTPRVP